MFGSDEGAQVSNPSAPLPVPNDDSTQRGASDASKTNKNVLSTAATQTQPTAVEFHGANDVLWRTAVENVRKEVHWRTWREFEDDLGGREPIQLSQIISRLKRTIQDCEDRKWRVQMPVGSTVVTPRDVLDKIVGYAEAFKDIGGTLASIDPTQSAGLA